MFSAYINAAVRIYCIIDPKTFLFFRNSGLSVCQGPLFEALTRVELGYVCGKC